MTTTPNPDSRDWEKITVMVAAAIIWLLFMLFMLFMLSSCTTLHKATLYMDNHFGDAAGYCARRFPTDTILKPGITITSTDTAYLPGEQIPCPDLVPDSGKKITVQCPPAKVIRVTTVRVDTIPKLDHAAVAALSAQNTKLNDQNITTQLHAQTAEKGRKWWRMVCLITWAIMAAAAGGFIVSKFSKFGI